MSHLLTAGPPMEDSGIEPHGSVWRHRSVIVGLMGFGVLDGLALAIALVT